MAGTTIFLDHPIFAGEFDRFKTKVENSKDKVINVYLSSVGGSVDEGLSMANYIAAISNKEIHTNILSNADSIATVIFLGAKKENRHAVSSSRFFVHNPSLQMFMESMDEKKVLDLQKSLDFEKNRLLNYYEDKISSLSREEMSDLMSKETPISAEQLKEYGVINEVMEKFDIAAFNQSKYNTNNNTNNNIINNKEDKNMGLFGKKENETKAQLPLNILKLNDEVTIAFEGDLVEGMEVTQVGSVEELTGEFEVDGQKITIDKNVVGKIEKVEAEAEKPADNKFSVEDLKTEILDQVKNEMSPINTQMENIVKSQSDVLNFLNELKGLSSNTKPPVNEFTEEPKEFDFQKEMFEMKRKKHQEIIDQRNK